MNQKYPVSDKALIKAAQRGDREAAAWLYRRHVEKVHRICYRIVLDPSQVQDCVQEVWLKVFRHLDRFRSGRSFAAWLNTVTANTAIDYYRKWMKEKNHSDINKIHGEALVADKQPASHPSDEALVQERIREALEEISVNQRSPFGTSRNCPRLTLLRSWVVPKAPFECIFAGRCSHCGPDWPENLISRGS